MMELVIGANKNNVKGKNRARETQMLDTKSFLAGVAFGLILGILLGIILEANFFFFL